jgi:hypothetical protein
MNTTAHGAYAFLIYVLFLQLFWHAWPNGFMCFFIIAAGMAPDLDGVYYVVIKKQSMNDPKSQHHLHSWTHWPSSYIPLVIVVALSIAFQFYPQYFLIALVGPGSHLLFDSISCGDGMMWGASWWGVKKGNFAKFINLDSAKTDGYHGEYYTARYRQTKYFLLENIAAIIVNAFLIWRNIVQGFDIWYGGAILALAGSAIIGLRPVNPKYREEPPLGRYADYHIDPSYIVWYQAKYGSLPPKKYGDK